MARTSTARHFQVSVTVNGRSLGTFDQMSGGATTAEATKHSSSSFLGRRAALGNPPETEDVTLRRFFDYERDHAEAKSLRPLVGLAEVTVSRQPKDINGSPYGRPEIYTGVLSGIVYPEFNVDSSDLSLLELTVTVDGDVG